MFLRNSSATASGYKSYAICHWTFTRMNLLCCSGPGQCGKTTIINILSGLDTPTAGEVFQNGQKVAGPGPERAVVYQSISLFPWLSVMGNVEFGLKAVGTAKAERLRRGAGIDRPRRFAWF